MRGSHALLEDVGGEGGSIPAHAGEPTGRATGTFTTRVYPRACGGADSSEAEANGVRGLSPRMRGSRVNLIEEKNPAGSIPAHAGEPPELLPGATLLAVYPRACGGASFSPPFMLIDRGLSPRMRGSQPAGVDSRFWRGSIPAHAGEPPRPLYSCADEGVYPRACGGACPCLTFLTRQ